MMAALEIPHRHGPPKPGTRLFRRTFVYPFYMNIVVHKQLFSCKIKIFCLLYSTTNTHRRSLKAKMVFKGIIINLPPIITYQCGHQEQERRGGLVKISYEAINHLWNHSRGNDDLRFSNQLAGVLDIQVSKQRPERCFFEGGERVSYGSHWVSTGNGDQNTRLAFDELAPSHKQAFKRS